MRKLYGKVTDREIKLQSAFAGVQGEAGATALVLSFSADWFSLGKRVIFLNAHHENPVSVLLGVDRLYGADENSYLLPIPKEALAYPGDALLIVEGTKEGTNMLARTLTCCFHVEAAPTGKAENIIKDEALQLQAQLDGIKQTLIKGMADAEEIGDYALRAEQAAEQAEAHAGVALAASRNCLLATGQQHAACFQGKANVPKDWVQTDNGFFCDIPTENILSTDALFMFVPNEKKSLAERMGLLSCESGDGYIRLCAQKSPEESFLMPYTWIRGVIVL